VYVIATIAQVLVKFFVHSGDHGVCVCVWIVYPNI